MGPGGLSLTLRLGLSLSLRLTWTRTLTLTLPRTRTLTRTIAAGFARPYLRPDLAKALGEEGLAKVRHCEARGDRPGEGEGSG